MRGRGMDHRSLKIQVFLSLIIGLSAALFGHRAEAGAADRRISTLRSLFATAPADYAHDGKAYDDFFGKADKQIQKEYESRWQFHEQQMQWASLSYRDEFFSIGSMDYYGRAPRESEVRAGFASQVFRLKVDSAIKEYLAAPERAKEFKAAKQTLDAINNVSIGVPGGSKQSGEFKLGYDVFNDSSRLEYVGAPIEWGIYHPSFLSSLSGAAKNVQITTRLSARPGQKLPGMHVSHALRSDNFRASLTKDLSSSVSSELGTTQPVRSNSATPRGYDVRFVYRF